MPQATNDSANQAIQKPTKRFDIPGSTLPLRYLGMGIYLAWIYSVQFGSVTSPSPIPGATVEPLFLISNFINALTLIICALNAHRLMAYPKRTILPWIAAIIMCAGTLFMALPSTLLAETQVGGYFATIASVSGAVLTGLGLAVIILIWSQFYAALPMRQVALYYSSSFILATIIHFLIVALEPHVALLITAALPIMSVVCFVGSMNMIKLQQTTADSTLRNEANAIAAVLERDSNQKWSFPVRPMLLMAAYSFTMNFCRTTGGVVNDLTMLGVSFAALVVLVFAIFFFDRFDVRYLFRIALPLMVAGALLQPFLQDSGLLIAGIMLNMSHASFVILTMIVLSTICSRYGVLAIWLFGLTRAARVIASVVGSYLGTSAWATLDQSGIMLITDIVVIVLVAFSMFLLNETDLETTWGITPIKTRHETASYRESLAGRCAQVARKSGLTLREEEILALLAQGKSTPRIQQELCISNGTAKSHIRHIYAKLNVHSRDEVIQLINSTSE